MAETTTPKWNLEDAIRRGEEALRLGKKYQDPLVRRLKAGALEGLESDLSALKESPAERQAAMTEQKGKTGDERDTADDGHDWVMSVREAAKRTRGLPAGTLKALGLGESIDAGNTNAVRGAIKAILDKLGDEQELVGGLGLIPEDLDEGHQLYGGLGGADAAQTEAMAAGKGKTFDKNAVQLKVESAVDEISSRGRVAFRKDKVVRALFEALVSSSGPSSRGGSGEGGPTPPAGE